MKSPAEERQDRKIKALEHKYAIEEYKDAKKHRMDATWFEALRIAYPELSNTFDQLDRSTSHEKA